MFGVVGVEIAEAIWPIVKVVGILAGVLGAGALIVRSIRKSGATRVEVKILQEADEARLRFEKDRARERRESLGRLADRRARLRGGDGSDGDPA